MGVIWECALLGWQRENWGSDLLFDCIPQHLPFRVMMEKYAEMRGKPVKNFKFSFDGELLMPDMLPGDVDLDEDDTIDVIEAKG